MIISLSPYLCFSQNNSSIAKKILSKQETPKYIEFDTSIVSYRLENSENILFKFLELRKNIDSYKEYKEIKDEMGGIHKKYQQYYKDILVEGGEYIVHSMNGIITSINGNVIKDLNINVLPAVSKNIASQNVIKFVNSQIIDSVENRINENDVTLYPPSFCITKDYFNSKNYCLAYIFLINTKIPKYRCLIYLNSHSGKIARIKPLIWGVAGTADTRYSGQRTIETQVYGDDYRLRDYSRGNGIITLNNHNSYIYGNATDFLDNDNSWTAAEYHNSDKDDGALDAHWAAGWTYDYFNNIHSRNSFDNNGQIVYQYVHFGGFYDTYWDPNDEVICLSDGDNVAYDIFTSLDVVAHEFGHGVCQHTANLDYEYHSGALNEGFSDIWAACVEDYANAGKQIWLIGEDIRLNAAAERSLENPNAYYQPDTYGGTYWFDTTGCIPTVYNDYCGVHTNMSVLSHWFYLLSEGGCSTNDNYDDYLVKGISINNASRIAYRTLTVYLTSTSGFADARYYAIQSAKNIFGNNSDDAVSTQNAWYAVGVGNIDNPLLISHTINSGIHNYATLNIKASNTITGTANVTYRGRSSVILDNNFKVDVGAVFNVVAGCP